MDSHQREELLSAYVDNELSAEDRARVERWLAEDAEYRRLHEELLSLRNELQALPRHKLPSDLAATVVRRAEQQVLRGKPAERSVGLAPPRASVAEWWSRGRSGRMFFWPALAVAAALLVALFNTQVDDRDVALDDSSLKDSYLKDNNLKYSASKPGHEPAAGELELGAADEPTEGAPATASGYRRDATPAMRSAEQQRVGQVPSEIKSAPDAEDPFAPQFSEPRQAAGAMKNAAPDAAARATPNGVPQQQFFLGTKVETNVQRALENRAQVNLIQCDVTPAFLDENPLEKVLSGNKIAFKRFAIPQADTKSNRAIRSQSELAVDDNLGYACEATPKQVETIVIELEQEQSRRRVSNLIIGLQEPLGALKAQAAEAKPADRPDELNANDAQQPVTIYLRKQGAPQQAPPAAPEQDPPAEPAQP
ncbi:MAG: zf-HC2 domain-containing protein [Pirellulales bacterium]